MKKTCINIYRVSRAFMFLARRLKFGTYVYFYPIRSIFSELLSYSRDLFLLRSLKKLFPSQTFHKIPPCAHSQKMFPGSQVPMIFLYYMPRLNDVPCLVPNLHQWQAVPGREFLNQHIPHKVIKNKFCVFGI